MSCSGVIFYVWCSGGIFMWRVVGGIFYVSNSGGILMCRVVGVF